MIDRELLFLEVPKIRIMAYYNFDPKKLIPSAKKEHPEYEWLPEQLESLGEGKWDSRFYVNYDLPEGVERLAKFHQECLELEDTPYGELVIDIFKDNLIGGIEFYGELMNAGSDELRNV